MAARVSHKRPHKFKKRKVVKEKHKIIRKRKVAIRDQGETEKPQGEIQEGIVAVPTPVVATGFPKPYEEAASHVVTPPTSVTEQPHLAAVPFSISSETPEPTVGVKQPLAKPVQENPPLPDTEPAHKKSKLWVILVFVAILLLVGGGLYYLREEFISKTADEEKKSQASPSPSEVSPTQALEENAATASADVKVDPSKHSIKVLNGSGFAGEAAKVRDILEGAGFVVEDIGNADTSDYEKTVIQAKKDVSKEFLDLLRLELGKFYLLDTNQELEEGEDVDAVIIIGSGEV